ncbi:FG-GAP-like repeat-containing protein [Gammaproteobacteria bacterium]|nr:FG-GAP-like repeat-containing protein [Gammaproteobacteria bacterium]
MVTKGKTVRFLLASSLISIATACGQPEAYSQYDAELNDHGVAQMGRYEYDDAHATFSSVVESAPSWLDAHVNLAIATLNRQREGDEKLALSTLKKVLEKAAQHQRALYTSGLIHLYLGQTEQAIPLFQEVAAADPGDAYAAYFLGQALLQTGDYEEASTWLVRAIELDPYLRSAYWAASQALRRTKRVDEATNLLEDYQRFEPNPAAKLAGFSYKRMGPKAEALATPTPPQSPPEIPNGALFNEPQQIDLKEWNDATLTSVDVNGDGLVDLVVTTTRGTTIFQGNPERGFTVIEAHPLNEQTGAPLWGDVDNDGLVDVAFCSPEGARLWRQTIRAQWDPIAVDADEPCVAGALFDSDHDGDLDLFFTGPSGNLLLSNNHDGTFRSLAEDVGLRGQGGTQIIATDLDADRDLDLMVLGPSDHHDIWYNDRTWRYRNVPALEDLSKSAIKASTVADANADGFVEIYVLQKSNGLGVWQRAASRWQFEPIIAPARSKRTWDELAVNDFNGDGRPDLLLSGPNGFDVFDLANDLFLFSSDIEIASAIAVTLQPEEGPTVVVVGKTGLYAWHPGPGRHPFLTLIPTGKSEAEQMRSNASGIGTRIKVRSGGRWSVLESLDSHSGPGQSLSPISVGLAGEDKANFIALEWSDGVSQSESNLSKDEVHTVAEIQRQLASCPVVFAWDGSSYQFATDVLGVGGLGFLAEPGIYNPARPFERYLMRTDQLRPRNGRYLIKLTEPMEEAAYLDAATIEVYDLPEGWSLALDERMGVADPAVTGRAIAYRHSITPNRATNQSGDNVTNLVSYRDERAPNPGSIDQRFIGLLDDHQVLTLEFDEPIETDGAVLLADGWIEYGYSQTVFAAWQAGKRYQAPSIEVRDKDGLWHPLLMEFGYPAGMPKAMAVPLTNLPSGINALRLSTNMEIYWDRIQIVWEESLAGVSPISIQPVSARIGKIGFPKRTTAEQRLPNYDYNDRAPYWDTKYQAGFYTALGDAHELIEKVDGALAIIGGGEEIHMEFPALAPVLPGYERYFVLDFRGYAKDMDLYTEHGETIAPLPSNLSLDTAALAHRDRLHERYNVRFQAGR